MRTLNGVRANLGTAGRKKGPIRLLRIWSKSWDGRPKKRADKVVTNMKKKEICMLTSPVVNQLKNTYT